MSMIYTPLITLIERYEKYYKLANQCLDKGNEEECEIYRNLAKYYKDRIAIRKNKVKMKIKMRENRKLYSSVIPKYPPIVINIDFSIMREFLFKYIDDSIKNKHHTKKKVNEIKKKINLIMESMKKDISIYFYSKILGAVNNKNINFSHPDKSKSSINLHKKCDEIYLLLKSNTYFFKKDKIKIFSSLSNSVKYTLENYKKVELNSRKT